MKKIFGLIRTKEREEKALQNTKKADAKADKLLSPSQSHGHEIDQPRDLFWDDYSDVGYC